MSVRDQMLEAKALIDQKRYKEARQILETIDHPKAKEWLAKINAASTKQRSEMGSIIPSAPAPAKRKNDEIALDSVELQLRQAKKLIQLKQYDEARDLLETIDHPTAQRWLQKVEEMALFGAANEPETQVIVNQKQGPGCLVQGIWFLFFGWWLGQVWIAFAWFFMLTIIGLPLAIYMIHRVSQVVALRAPAQKTVVTVKGGKTTVNIGAQVPQVNLLVRILYFIFFGWWLTGLWLQLAYFFCVIIIGMPLGFWMFDRTPSVLTLKRV